MEAIVKFPSKFSISSSNIQGFVFFQQHTKSEPVKVMVNLSNLPNGIHGFHIHEYNITDNMIKKFNNKEKINICKELGGHFNPYNTYHGSYKYNTNRHAGDLINNLVVNNNKVEIIFYDNLISLFADEINCIINKSIVIHEETDDEGLPGFIALINGKKLNKMEEESLKTGNAGKRIACGNITLINFT